MSASWVVMSGLGPGVTLRNSLSTESSPKATEELDCSPVKRVPSAVGVELVARAGGGRSARRPRRAPSAAAPNACSHSARRRAVVQRVVGVDPAEVGVLPPADERVVEAVLGLGVVGQRHLVELGARAARRRRSARPAARRPSGRRRRGRPRRRTPETAKSRPLPPNQRVRVEVGAEDGGSMPVRSGRSQELPLVGVLARHEPEPVEAVAAQGEQVGQLADPRGTGRRRASRPAPSPRSGAGRARPAAGSATGC